jgi:hypothetical protein
MLESNHVRYFSDADLVALQVPENEALPLHEFSLAG